MKNAQNTRRAGTILFIAGCVLLLAAFVCTLAFGGGAQEALTASRRLEIAQSLEKTASTARTLLSGRVEDMRAYYEKLGYTERAEMFSALQTELTAGGAVSDGAYARIRGLRSVDGVEEEVTPLNNLQNQLRIIRENEREAARQRAVAEGKQSASLRERVLASRPLGLSLDQMNLGMAVLAALLIVVGLYLNHSYRTKRALSQTALYVLLVIGAVIMVFPFYWMLSSSLKTRVEVSRFPPEFAPGNFLNFENYRIAFKQAPFARYFVNSVFVCACSVTIVTITTILAAFAFSRLKFPGREFVFSALLSMMMLPFEMLVITNYTTIIKVGLNDTLAALIVPFISSIFYTYIMRNFFASIPESLYWSARVDGCSNWRYLWKVMVPIGRPSLVTVVLLNALASWNSFMWPLLVIRTTINRTLPFGLFTFTTEAGAYQELIMAASAVVVLPMILLFLFARKQILRGVARGGLKG